MYGDGALIDDICQTLRACRLRFSDEKTLQVGLEQVLTASGYTVKREQNLQDDAGVIDFLVLGRTGEEPLPLPIGVEAKIKGSAADIARQLHRYAMSPKISGLILATSVMKHIRSIAIHETLNDKPYRTVHLSGSAF